MSFSLTLQDILEEDFFTLLGLQGGPEDEKEELLKTMNQTVQGRVYLTVYEMLPEDQRHHFSELSADDMIPYIEAQGIDLAALITEEAMRYRFELAATFKAAIDPDIAVTALPQEA